VERGGVGASGSGKEPVVGSSQNCNKLSGSIKGGRFLN
jgi:hypothetical protein